MLIGFNAPTAGPLSAADNLAKIVVDAEAMGFDYATFSDHVVIPTAIAAEYPYSASGEFPSGTRGERHEQLTEVTWIAAKTTRLRLVTSVMVVPHRPAVRGIAQGRGFCYQFGQWRVEPLPYRLPTGRRHGLSSPPAQGRNGRRGTRLPSPVSSRMVSHRRQQCNAKKDTTKC